MSVFKTHLHPLAKKMQIEYDAITEEYYRATYAGIEIIVMQKNGYVNATKLCQQGGKQFKGWSRLNIAEEIMEEIILQNPTIKEIKMTINGGSNQKITGTYVHPQLLTHVAMWISPKFQVKIGAWIEQWKSFSPQNSDLYLTSILSLDPSQSDQMEARVKQKLLKKYVGARCEVKTDHGYIDMVHDWVIIEIKNIKNYKNAVGQIIAYKMCLPTHRMRIVLFHEEMKVDEHLKGLINDLCFSLGIECVFYWTESLTIDPKKEINAVY